MNAGLAQVGKLVGRKVQIVDPQGPAFDIAAQMVDQPLVNKAGPVFMEFAAKARKTLAFTNDDAKHPLAEVRQQELHDTFRRQRQGGPNWRVALDRGFGLFGLPVAFAARDLKEHQPLVGKVGVDRRLRHASFPRDVIDRGTFEAVAQKDPARAFQHLVELAAAPDLWLSCCVHRSPWRGP